MKFFLWFLIYISSKLLIILHFDFLREPHSIVPLYADERGSLGFVAFSTVSCVSKNDFSTRRQAVSAHNADTALFLFFFRLLPFSAFTFYLNTLFSVI